MSELTSKYDPQQLQRLLSDLRIDIDRLRQRERPIKIRLTHRATNAEAEGVTPSPFRFSELTAAFLGAGHREARQNFDANGSPKFIDPPTVDVEGKPIVDSESGKGLDCTMPASRGVELDGDIDAVARLSSLAERGGRLAFACRGGTLRMLVGWQFSTSDELWWALVFELAWSGQHPLLTAKRQLWQTSEKGGLAFLPYDAEELRQLVELSPGLVGRNIPKCWLERLPDAYTSEIGDAASACSDLAAVLADELKASLSTGEADFEMDEDAGQPANGAAEPDVKGYVAQPTDPSAYVSAADIVKTHTPKDMPLTAKQLAVILGDHATNHVRWTRPAGKDGTPRRNRRSVHLTDWLAYVERKQKARCGVADDDWPVVSVDGMAERTDAFRSRKSAGK